MLSTKWKSCFTQLELVEIPVNIVSVTYLLLLRFGRIYLTARRYLTAVGGQLRSAICKSGVPELQK